MVRQGLATVRLVAAILLLVVSLQQATAQGNSMTTSIQITAERPLYAGNSYKMVCRVVGWDTPPKIFWWLNNIGLVNASEQLLISQERNECVSIVLLTPVPDDDGKTLKCQSMSSRGIQEESVNLQVYYPPTVSLLVDPPIQLDDIREGDNITLTCQVKANPPVLAAQWMFEGLEQQGSKSIGPENQTLILSLYSIDRTQSGSYFCRVLNRMGDAESLPIELIVKYPPKCRWHEPLVYVIAPGEAAAMECGGVAAPPPKYFRWTFRRALRSEMQPTLFSESGGPGSKRITFLEWDVDDSWRTYEPNDDLDYGTFYCASVNDVGYQQEECVYHVVPPGRPDVPFNCSVLNVTTESFVLWCSNTSDRGFEQTYQLEVYDGCTDEVRFSRIQKVPEFHVGRLPPNRPIKMRIRALSVRGCSEWLRMNTFTLKTPPATAAPDTMSPVIRDNRNYGRP